MTKSQINSRGCIHLNRNQNNNKEHKIKMKEEFDLRRFRSGIIENSKAKTWSEAKEEWELITIYNAEGHCICGHRIMEQCKIVNRETGIAVIVGNVCINQFEVPRLFISPKARSCLKNIENRVTASINEELLKLAIRLQIITEGQAIRYKYLTKGSGSKKRFNKFHPDFNEDVFAFREKINTYVRLGFHQRRPKCECGRLACPRRSKRGYFYGCIQHNFKDYSGCKFIEDAKKYLLF